jgi:hypothetical protein
VSVKELIDIDAWYIWWQRRKHVKGDTVASPEQPGFAIQVLTMNYIRAESHVEPCEILWCKQISNTYKLNIDACFFMNELGGP